MARWWEKEGRIQWDQGRALEHDRWWVPIGNILPSVRAEMAGMPDRIMVKDDTLREGEEQPSHKPITVETKVKLAHALEEAGIEETEVGFPATLESHRVLCKALRDDGIKMRFSGHTSRFAADYKKDLDSLASAGVNVAFMSFLGTEADIRRLKANGVKISDEHTNDDLCERATNVIRYAKSLGLIVRAGMSTASKAPLERVAVLYRAFSDAGSDRVSVTDGNGFVIPENLKFYVKFIRNLVRPDIKIQCHLHNDYGLANANAVAAVTAGCGVLDLSVNGLGDRAGISALEVVVPILEILYGVDTGVKLEKMQYLSDLVEELYGIRMQQHYPIVGDSMWVHEEDPHIARILLAREAGRDAWTGYNIINPEVFGAKEKLQFSLTSVHKGPGSCLAIKIRQMGLSATDEQFDELIARILAISEKKQYATEEEVEKLIEEILASQKCK